jgi:hypothetical protein
MEKFYIWKKIDIFLSTIAIYLSLGLHKGRPSYRRSLQLSKENIFLFLSVIYAHLDLDPVDQNERGLRILANLDPNTTQQTKIRPDPHL